MIGCTADSVADFSPVQGAGNWWYGWYGGPFTPSDFQRMTFNGTFWEVDFTRFYTLLNASGGHPNGTLSSRLPDVHWAVRRWVSPLSGTVTISGVLAKTDRGDGNGVSGRIFHDGTEIFTRHIADNDSAGISWSLDAAVLPGSIIDFAIDPETNTRFDSTTFTANIRVHDCDEAAPAL